MDVVHFAANIMDLQQNIYRVVVLGVLVVLEPVHLDLSMNSKDIRDFECNY